MDEKEDEENVLDDEEDNGGYSGQVYRLYQW